MAPGGAAAGLAADSVFAGPPADSATATAPADSASATSPAPADSIASTPAGATSQAAGSPAPPARARRTLEDHGAFSTPRWVMLRSAVVPGWGQAYNRRWWKAGVVAAVEGGLAYRIYDDNRILDDLDRQASAALAAGDRELQNELALRYNDRLDTMVARQWLLAGVIVYSLLDAYVDAHFRDFDIEFKTDPALPEDPSGSAGARVGLRWSF